MERCLVEEAVAVVVRESTRLLDWQRMKQKRAVQSPMGIILCAGKNTEQIQLLELGSAGIFSPASRMAQPSRRGSVQGRRQALPRLKRRGVGK